MILFLFGFLFSFVGSITPSMLNITALKISLENGRIAANKYAVGVSIITTPQVVIAVVLVKYLAENLTILETLEKAGILIFILLSYYFYSAYKNEKVKIEASKIKKGNPFLTGIILSFLNIFSIPFFCGTIIGLDAIQLFNFNNLSVVAYTLGAVFGTFYILYLYGKYAKLIQLKTGKLTKEINLILSVLTALFAFFSLVKLLYSSIF